MEAWGLGLGSDGLQRVFLSACLLVCKMGKATITCLKGVGGGGGGGASPPPTLLLSSKHTQTPLNRQEKNYPHV